MSKSVESAATKNADPGGTAVSPDEGFDLLSNHRRRYVLHYLSRTEQGVADIGDLSERIAAWENDVSVRDVSSDERKRVYTALQQLHLPRMAEANVVEFDDRAGTVELGPAAKDLDVYLEVVSGRDVPWSQFYLALSAVNLALLAAVATNTYPFALLPDLAWGVFTATTVAVAAGVHTYLTQTEMQLQGSDRPPELEK